MKTSVLWTTLVTAMALSCASRSGLDGNTFRHGDIAFRVGPIPQDWRLLDDPNLEGDLASFAFRSDRQQITVGVAGRCGRDSDDVPLRSLTQHLTLGFTNKSVAQEQPFVLDGRAALRTELTARLDGVSKHLVLVVVKKDTCVYDFWRIGESDDDSVAQFDRFVQGFSTLN